MRRAERSIHHWRRVIATRSGRPSCLIKHRKRTPVVALHIKLQTFPEMAGRAEYSQPGSRSLPRTWFHCNFIAVRGAEHQRCCKQGLQEDLPVELKVTSRELCCNKGHGDASVKLSQLVSVCAGWTSIQCEVLQEADTLGRVVGVSGCAGGSCFCKKNNSETPDKLKLVFITSLWAFFF